VTATVEYDPSSYEIQDDPFTVYRWLRDEAPLYRNDRFDFWALTRFTDVLAALGDPATYSSAQGTQLESGGASLAIQQEMMLFKDPPDHTVLRKLVSRAFTPRRVAEMEATVRDLCSTFLDDLAASGGGDLVDGYAGRLPMTVIASLVGIPLANADDVRDWADRINHRDPGSVEPPADAAAAGMELYLYFDAMLKERRAAPQDDMASALVATGITQEQAVMFCVLLALGGYETTTKLIANLAVALARHPDQRALVAGDAALVPNAVDESLRHDSPSHYQARVTTTDVVWHGTTVPAGARILLVNGAANRDDREFAAPDDFDLRRSPERHLAFGHGPHFCIGASLARLEARVALEVLLERCPSYEIDLDNLERRHSSNFRGLSKAPVALRNYQPR
jgi:cytochrome P450